MEVQGMERLGKDFWERWCLLGQSNPSLEEEKVFLAEEEINLEAVDTALGLEVKLPMLCHKCGWRIDAGPCEDRMGLVHEKQPWEPVLLWDKGAIDHFTNCERQAINLLCITHRPNQLLIAAWRFTLLSRTERVTWKPKFIREKMRSWSRTG